MLFSPVFVFHNSRPCPPLPPRSHPSVGSEIGSLQSFQHFTLQPFKQISSRDEKPVTATPLLSTLTNRDAHNSFRIRSYANCRVSLAFSPNSQTLHVPLSSLAATLMDPPRKCCKQKTYARLTPQLNHLDATLTKNRGVGYPSHSGTLNLQNFQPANLPTGVPYFLTRSFSRFFSSLINSCTSLKSIYTDANRTYATLSSFFSRCIRTLSTVPAKSFAAQSAPAAHPS